MATESPGDTTGSLSPPAPVQGSRIEHGHTVRRMRELVIYEKELDDVGLLNTLSWTCFSAASGCFLFAIGLITSAVIQGFGSLPVEAIVLLKLGIPIGLVLSAGFAFAGYFLARRKHSTLSAMKQQAEDIEQIAPSPIPGTYPLTSQPEAGTEASSIQQSSSAKLVDRMCYPKDYTKELT